jgi:hypothetical protein
MKTALFYGVEPDFLNAMGIPLKHGRFLTAADNERAPPVFTIDEQIRQAVLRRTRLGRQAR